MQLMKIKQPGGNLKKRSAIRDEVNSNESLVFSEYAKTINVGSLIRKTRKELGFSLQKVADRSGLSVSFVSQAERGILPPSVSSLKKIATALEIPAGMLMFNSGDNSGPTMVSVIRRNDRKKIVLPQSNAHYE
ncbi:MAG: XRE family transcriptional regulator, partial [Betaproteobacteria bacterium]|nr:XRE family transcriptional regulator [Betaproteobacteria bacterium]